MIFTEVKQSGVTVSFSMFEAEQLASVLERAAGDHEIRQDEQAIMAIESMGAAFAAAALACQLQYRAVTGDCWLGRGDDGPVLHLTE